TESYAMLFAFLSLIDPDPAKRSDFAQRSRTLLMYVMDRAVLGPAALPFRHPSFATSDRSRWEGHAFPLTVDWIYPSLSAQDKATIRTVFTRWAQENMGAYPNPSTFGSVDPALANDPALLRLNDPNRSALRYAGNNYFMAHLRNNGLMALALDAADDPDGRFAATLRNATGAWLYMQDYLYRHDARGGLSPEGFLYMPSTGFVLQFLLALHTAGQDDPQAWGAQVALSNNPYWSSIVPAYLHSLSPLPVNNPDYGSVYQPAWYGDGERFMAGETITMFGPLGVYDALSGNTARLNQIRWLQTNTPPGGSAEMLSRAGSQESLTGAIFYFLLFDPASPPAPDPRPALNTSHFSPGLGRIMARTGWDASARWFNYKLSWVRIDHQSADGNMIDFYRKGEWLTKERTGYGTVAGSSDYKNTLSVQNSPPVGDSSSIQHILATRGSQFILGLRAGDPTLLAQRVAPEFVYALGDATPLYNSAAHYPYQDVTHVSRSVVWLKSDVVVVYDRATTQTAGRFKRFWLNMPGVPTLAGNVATARTAGGQQLFVTTVLPTQAETRVVTQDATLESWSLADYDPMVARLQVAAPGGPATARFLHVLEGADSGATRTATERRSSLSGAAFDGVVVGRTAVWFPVTLAAAGLEVTYRVPAGVTRQLVTGLRPNSGYTVESQSQGGEIEVSVTEGGSSATDSAGVLIIGGAAPKNAWIPAVVR
ncbi:MAG TPA: hypothetical protein VD886_13925, partial [Herpetosiphonaceae bacterium]|nr:hypothetical protein [Herpetosiphonaceae bacterium]